MIKEGHSGCKGDWKAKVGRDLYVYSATMLIHAYIHTYHIYIYKSKTQCQLKMSPMRFNSYHQGDDVYMYIQCFIVLSKGVNF